MRSYLRLILDEWDACIFFVSGLIGGMVPVIALGGSGGVSAVAGMVAAILGIVVRRIRNPSLLERELPQQGPLSAIALVPIAFGIFGMLVSAFGVVLTCALVADPKGDFPRWACAIFGAVAITGAVGSAGLIALGRRLRR